MDDGLLLVYECNSVAEDIISLVSAIFLWGFARLAGYVLFRHSVNELQPDLA